MYKESLENNYQDIVNDLLTFSLGEASAQMLPQTNYLDSRRFNFNYETIHNSLKDMYLNIRELEDLIGYIKYYTEEEVSAKTESCRKLIENIEELNMNIFDNTIIREVGFDNVFNSTFKDRDGNKIRQCNIYDNKLVPNFINLYDSGISDVRVIRSEKPYKATFNNDIIKGDPYRVMYLLNSPKENGITEEFTIKLKSPEIINSINIDTSYCSIEEVSTVDINNTVIKYSREDLVNINPQLEKIKEVRFKTNSKSFKTTIYEKEKAEKDFITSIKSGSERSKIIDEYNRYNKNSLYLLEELENLDDNIVYENGIYKEREIENSYEELVGAALDPEVSLVYQYLFGINNIRITFTESEDHSFYLSKPIVLNKRTKELEIIPEHNEHDGSIEYFIIHKGKKIEVPISPHIKNERFYEKTRFKMKDKKSFNIRNKVDDFENINNGDLISYETTDSNIVDFEELILKNLEKKYIEEHEEEFYSDNEGFFGKLNKCLVEGELTYEEKKYIVNNKTEYYEDEEGYFGKLKWNEEKKTYYGFVYRGEKDNRIYKYEGYVYKKDLTEEEEKELRTIRVGAILRRGEISDPYIEKIQILERADQLYE